MNSSKKGVVVFLALVMGACEPPTVDMEPVEVAPPEYAAEFSELAVLCRERSRVARMAASIERVGNQEGLSRGTLNVLESLREDREALAKRVLGIFSMTRQPRRVFPVCQPPGPEGEGTYLDFGNPLDLMDEVEFLLELSGSTLESIGTTREEFRVLVQGDLRLRLQEPVGALGLELLMNRACSRGFGPEALGVNPFEAPVCGILPP